MPKQARGSNRPRAEADAVGIADAHVGDAQRRLADLRGDLAEVHRLAAAARPPRAVRPSVAAVTPSTWISRSGLPSKTLLLTSLMPRPLPFFSSFSPTSSASWRSSLWSGPNSFTSIGLFAPDRSFSSSCMIWISLDLELMLGEVVLDLVLDLVHDLRAAGRRRYLLADVCLPFSIVQRLALGFFSSFSSCPRAADAPAW